MLKLQLATIADDLLEELGTAIESAHEYLNPNSATFTKLSDELDKLGKVDAISRSVLLVLLYALCGDRTKAEYYADNARRIGASEFDVQCARLTVLLNLGYFSEGLHVMQRLGPPQVGVAYLLMRKNPCNGAFHTLSSMFDQATEMNILNLPLRPVELRIAADIMDQWGDTDEDYSNALDIAGGILREKHLYFQDDIVVRPNERPADGSAPYVRLSFKVAVDLDSSIDMTSEFIDRLAKSGLKIPPSMIFEFEGTKE